MKYFQPLFYQISFTYLSVQKGVGCSLRGGGGDEIILKFKLGRISYQSFSPPLTLHLEVDIHQIMENNQKKDIHLNFCLQ